MRRVSRRLAAHSGAVAHHHRDRRLVGVQLCPVRLFRAFHHRRLLPCRPQRGFIEYAPDRYAVIRDTYLELRRQYGMEQMSVWLGVEPLKAEVGYVDGSAFARVEQYVDGFVPAATAALCGERMGHLVAVLEPRMVACAVSWRGRVRAIR